MVRILGASYERIEIKDLGDVIYYHQQKDFTDQQFEGSRDLQREIQKGRVVVLSRSSAPISSVPDMEIGIISQSNNAPSFSLQDIKNSIKDIIPSIIDAVRQEVKQSTPQTVYINSGEMKAATQTAQFVGPEYVPDVNMDGMTSSIKTEEKKVSGDDMNSALEALKNMGLGK